MYPALGAQSFGGVKGVSSVSDGTSLLPDKTVKTSCQKVTHSSDRNVEVCKEAELGSKLPRLTVCLLLLTASEAGGSSNHLGPPPRDFLNN